MVFNIAEIKAGDKAAAPPEFSRAHPGRLHAPPQIHGVPVYLYLDEFHNFVSPSIKELFTELRKFALHLTIAQQYEGQEGNPRHRHGHSPPIPRSRSSGAPPIRDRL